VRGEPAEPRQAGAHGEPVGGDAVVRRHDAPQRAGDQHAAARAERQLGRPQVLVEDAGVDRRRARGRRGAQPGVALQLAGEPRAQLQGRERGVGRPAAQRDERVEHLLARGGQLRVRQGGEIERLPALGRGLALGGRQEDEHGAPG
jgi:hypothetical protein